MSGERLQEQHNTQLFCINHDTLVIILEFLMPRDLCKLSETSKYFRDIPIWDLIWELIFRRRWNTQERTKKNLSVDSWKQAYQLLHCKNQIPEGRYTGKRQNVFAQGNESTLMSSWVMISHGNNAVLRTTRFHSSTWNVVEVRLCIQNLHQSQISVNLDSSLIQIIAFHSDELESDNLHTANVQCIAINGEQLSNLSSPQASNMLLNPLDFMVVSFSVYCPTSVQNEPDFLTMIDTFEVFVQVQNYKSNLYDQTRKVSLSMMSDSIIWNMYSTLPSGVVLLKDRSMISAV